MGCDIHLFVERREDGVWKSLDTWQTEKDDGREYLSVDYDRQFYNGRNYNLFAILADVRNGRGFAGIKTGEGFIPIAPPRGVPDDANDNYKKYVEQWDGDGHSHSYFTVAELLAYDWTQTTTLTGWIDAATFAEWEFWGRGRGEAPDGWCGGISGHDIQHVPEGVMRERIKEVIGDQRLRDPGVMEAIKTKLRNFYCQSQWTQHYYQCTGGFLGETMPKLWALGKPEDVRILFLFDN